MPKRRVTLSVRQMHREATRNPRLPVVHFRPWKREQCEDAPRPCPFVGCRYHLFADTLPSGSLRLPFGEDVEVLAEAQETCALDVAARGGHDMRKIGEWVGVTPARIQQEVAQAVHKVGAAMAEMGLTFEDLIPEQDSDLGDETSKSHLRQLRGPEEPGMEPDLT